MKKKLLYALAVDVLLLVSIELGFRVVLRVTSPESYTRVHDWRARWMSRWEEHPIVRPHPYMAYTASPEDPHDMVNELGFYGPVLDTQHPEDTLRIACFGGSTTAGPESWPRQLELLLPERSPGLRVQVQNFGVQGWTSAEAVVAMALLAQDYRPDIVVLHTINNDLAPMQAEGFRPDYAHWRRTMPLSEDAQLSELSRLHLSWFIGSALGRTSDLYVYARLWVRGDTPAMFRLDSLTTWDRPRAQRVPAEATRTYRRNLETIGLIESSLGGTMALATMPWLPGQAGGPGAQWEQDIRAQNERARRIARENGWVLADLEADMQRVPAEFTDVIHLTTAGQRRKAERIADALRAAGVVP